MTHENFKVKLADVNLTLKEFSILIDTPYSTVAKYGKSNPVPSFVKPFLEIYEQNKKLENIKQEIKSLAKKL